MPTKRIMTFTEPTGHRYEDRYSQYLDFFKDVAETPADHTIDVSNVSWCWVPLLIYLNCRILNPIHKYQYCNYVKKALWLSKSALTREVTTSLLDRTAIEVLCGFRPECVDALYKIDTQWNVQEGRTLKNTAEEFIVTNNGSFHRREVLDFMKKLDTYQPTKRKVLIVPCAADKPYPAPLHKACLEILPDDYYMAIATGVLGIVPQDMWANMPMYDSGIPNQWRLYERTKNYFYQHNHNHIVIYCDFYAHVLLEAFRTSNKTLRNIDFVLPPVKYDDYANLLSAENLSRLKKALSGDWI